MFLHFLYHAMEYKKEHFFNGENLIAKNVVQAIVANPMQWEQILSFIWDIMKDDAEFHMEKKWLKMKYEHDLKELCEEYGYDLEANK